MNCRTLTALVAALTLALAPLALAQTPDFEDLSSAATPRIRHTYGDAYLSVEGTLVGGDEDPLPLTGAGEYGLIVFGMADVPGGYGRLNITVVGTVTISTHLDGLKPGATTSFRARIPMRLVTDEGLTHIAIGLAEYDLFGKRDLLGSTGFLALTDLRAASGDARYTLKPTRGGTRLDLAYRWIPSHDDRLDRLAFESYEYDQMEKAEERLGLLGQSVE